MADPDVTIVVVTYEHADEIGACLDGAARQEQRGLHCEIVVVDNASGDDTVAVIAGRGDGVRLLARDRNPGFADGVNTGVAAGTGRHVLLLNPDAVMEPGCVAALVAHVDATPDCGAAAALLRNLDGGEQHFGRRRLSLPGLLWDVTRWGRERDAARRGDRGHAHRRYHDVDLDGASAPVRVDEAAAACLLLRRADLPDPPLDPRFPLMLNDSDLYADLRARGLHCDVVPAAVALHGYGTSLLRLDQAANRAEVVAAIRRYTRKHWPWWRALAGDAVLLWDAITTAAAYLRGGRQDYLARKNVQGILGGFGLPRGVKPWLSEPRLLRPLRPEMGDRGR
ncbi:MAG: glycosyltransferase family 2 protein [Solirubrobacteraceae bacterium]